MSTRAPAKRKGGFTPLEKLQISSAEQNALLLQNGPVLVEVSAIADDVYRLRITRRRKFSNTPSWAVQKVDRPSVKAGVYADHRVGKLETKAGWFTMKLSDGSWELRDRSNLVLFSAGPGKTGFDGEQARVSLSLEEEEAIFGLGESTGTFNKRGLVREFWNIDVGSHTRTVYAGVHNMYLSLPFGISLRHGRAAGVFWDNPAHQIWDVGQREFNLWKMEAASGEIDLYLFLGPNCEEILEGYTKLTGRMPLPPAWALGYQQCRYSYETRQRVEEVARMFRRKRIPCDVIYLDIHHMDGYRVFTFGDGFRKPAEMVRKLANQGFKVVTIVDPGVKDDTKFPVLQRGIDRDAFVKAADGQVDYLGKVWPGRVRFPDFLNPAARAWWAEEQTALQKLGIAGFWNDMNEPADFTAPDKDFPVDCVHTTTYGPCRHEHIHNVYGSEMARASYEGALAFQPDARPFIITRAGYAGLQRHAAVWTGDNDSSWEHMADSVQMLLNLSLSGVSFCGADAGGFHHNATGELLARWIQLAAFTPFFRNHSNYGTIDQEPWAFGPRIEAICRSYIELRYQLLPYLYSLFVEAHRTGAPIMRPLLWHHQNDPIAVATSDQFFLGPNLLISPVLRQGAVARSVYLPLGMWFDFWTGEATRGGQHVIAEAPLERLPMFVRAGAVLPFMPIQQFIGEKRAELVTLHIWPGTNGALNWYEDDGTSFQAERGSFYERQIIFKTRRRTSELTFSPATGTYASDVLRWRLVISGAWRPLRVRCNQRRIEARFDENSAVCIVEVPNQREGFSIQWS